MRTQYALTESGVTRGLSPKLWAGMPLDEIFGGPSKLDVGMGIFDDFDNFQMWSETGAATVLYGNNGTRGYIDTNVTISQLKYSNTLADSGAKGVLELALAGTADNDEGSIQWGGATGALFAFDDTAYLATTDIAKELAFEIRLRVSSIADNKIAFFVGLMEETCAIAECLVDDTGAVIDKDWIGFSKLHADGDAVNWAHKTNGQTLVTTKTGIHVPAANTWYKYGFRYNAQSKVVTPYINGDPSWADRVTATATAAATFPDAQGLMPIIAIKDGDASGAANQLDVDWICVAQVEQAGFSGGGVTS